MRIRLALSILSLIGLAAIAVVSTRPDSVKAAVRELDAQLGLPRITSGSIPLPAIAAATRSPQPVTAAAGQAAPGGAVYLYPQRGYPDGRGGVTRTDRVYEVYRLSDGSYWLRVADLGALPAS